MCSKFSMLKQDCKLEQSASASKTSTPSGFGARIKTKNYAELQIERDEAEAAGELDLPVFGVDFDEYDDPADWLPAPDFDPY